MFSTSHLLSLCTAAPSTKKKSGRRRLCSHVVNHVLHSRLCLLECLTLIGCHTNLHYVGHFPSFNWLIENVLQMPCRL